MKGTIGGLDGDGNFWCRACIEADSRLACLIKDYVSTLKYVSYICNRCDSKINNQPHLET